MRAPSPRSLLFIGTAAAVAATLGGRALAADAAPTAVDVVDRQLSAYNAKNVDAFLAFYAPDAIDLGRLDAGDAEQDHASIPAGGHGVLRR